MKVGWQARVRRSRRRAMVAVIAAAAAFCAFVLLPGIRMLFPVSTLPADRTSESWSRNGTTFQEYSVPGVAVALPTFPASASATAPWRRRRASLVANATTASEGLPTSDAAHWLRSVPKPFGASGCDASACAIRGGLATFQTAEYVRATEDEISNCNARRLRLP